MRLMALRDVAVHDAFVCILVLRILAVRIVAMRGVDGHPLILQATGHRPQCFQSPLLSL